MDKKHPEREEERGETLPRRVSERASLSLVPPSRQPSPSATEPVQAEDRTASDPLFDPVARARESNRFTIETLTAQLERAVDALIAHRLDDPANVEAHRRILFDLYESGIIAKPDVRRRGALEPAEFHDEIRKYRVRKRQS